MLSEAETFPEYLEQQRLAPSSIREHLKNIERFKKWSDTEKIDYEGCQYNELLKFIQYHQKKESSKATINNHLNSICKYYNYLISEGRITKNPARDLRVKKEGRRVLQNILTLEELEKIYQDYANKPAWSFREEKHKRIHQRNRVILGMLLYQGLHTGELKRVEKNHLHLAQGTIYIPSTRRSNSRVLKLQSAQIIPIQQYLLSFTGEKLFTGNLHNIINWLLQELRKISNRVKSANQLRSSVIVGWLKQHNLRQVQYLAGHKHISSTERYKQEDLADLQAQLELFHPMR